MTTALSPCPFCGAKGEGAEGALVVIKAVGWFKVLCTFCMAEGSDAQTVAAARERWNVRAAIAGTGNTGSTEGDSPTAESGDAQ